MIASLPDNEAERLAALREHRILDTAPEEEFDDLVRLAAHLCGVPIAAVSLVDEHRQWFKSIHGLDARETPREVAFCAHTILGPDLLIVPDAQADARFADNPLVTGDPRIRFYAGAPLITEEGYALGSLCVIDRAPRTLTPEQAETLRLLARQVGAHINATRRIAERERLVVEQRELIADREALLREKEALVSEKDRLAVARGRAEAERLRLAAIVEFSADAIYSMTLGGTLTSWNRAAEDLYGFTAEEITGRSADLFVPSERRPELKRILDAVRRGKNHASVKTVRVTKAGTRVDVALQVSAILDEDGCVVGASMIAHDITERNRAEDALQAEREFTNSLLESLQEGIVACDAQGTLTLFNRATREFHGLPEKALPPEQWAEHFDLYEADGLTPMRTEDIPLRRAFQGEVVQGAEMVVAPKSGLAYTLVANGRAIYGVGGERLGAVVAMHDVTERRQAERELSRLAAIVESSEDAILSATLDGTIVSWNQGAERLYGFTAGEVTGQNVAVLVPPGQKGPFPNAVARLLRGETGETVEVYRTHRDGAGFHVAISFSALRNSAGDLIGVSCIARNITGRKKAEAALAEAHAALAKAQRIARVGSWEYDLVDGRVTWSDEMFRLLGRDPDASVPGFEGAMAHYHPEDAPALKALVARAAGAGEGYELDLRGAPGFFPDGPTRWYHTTGETVTDAAGRVVRLTGTLADITERKQVEAERQEHAETLRRSEAALRAVLESAPVILYAADADGTVTLSEGTGLAALGLKPGEVVGRSVFEFGGGDEGIEGGTRQALAGECVSYDARVHGLCLHTELRPVRDGAGAVTGIIGVCFDLTERAQSEERFRVLFEQSSDAHLLLGADGIIDCNPAAVALLRCSDITQVLSLHPAVLSPEFQPDGRRSDEKSLEMDALARENGYHRFEWTHRTMDGEDFPVEVTLTPVTLGERSVLLVVWHDLSERNRAEQQAKDYTVVLSFQKNALEDANAKLEEANARLEDLATTDGLTGLKNHRAFQERLAEEVSRAARYGTPLSLVLLDVDHFKQFNDAYGHPAGDAVLRAVAGVLQGCARDTDIVARPGGEEFGFILPQTAGPGAAAFAERLRAAIEGHPWPVRAVTASFGVAVCRPGEKGGSDLVARADRAMYRSKTMGRNRVTCASAVAEALDALAAP